MSAVNDIYRKVFGTDADQAGQDYWNSTGLQGDDLYNAIRFAADQREQQRLEAYQAELGGGNDVLKNNDYTAYLRKMQFDESEINNATQAQRDALNRRIAVARGTYDFQRYQAGKSIEKDYARRGLRRAGGRTRDTNEANASVNQNQNKYEFEQRETMASRERESASRIAELRRERAEQERIAREQMTQDSVRR